MTADVCNQLDIWYIVLKFYIHFPDILAGEVGLANHNGGRLQKKLVIRCFVFVNNQAICRISFDNTGL